MQEFAEVIVAKMDDNIIGYASMYANNYENKTAYISMFGIKKKFQGKKLGIVLMDKCVEIARKKGMRVISLEVFKTNRNAISFYKAYGFKETGAETELSIYMSLKI